MGQQGRWGVGNFIPWVLQLSLKELVKLEPARAKVNVTLGPVRVPLRERSLLKVGNGSGFLSLTPYLKTTPSPRSFPG